MANKTICKEHLMVKSEIETLQKIRPISSTFATWTIAIFITLAMAIVSFLWTGQEKLSVKLDKVNDVIMEKLIKMDRDSERKIDSVGSKIENLTNRVIAVEIKVDEHVKRVGK